MDPETPQFALPALPQLREQKVFGRSIRYYDTGSGLPLVLVHGVGGDADHSLGGWIVASFALQYPDRVDKLILNDAAGIDEGAVPIAIDLNVSTCANMRAVFEAMFHNRSLVQDALVENDAVTPVTMAHAFHRHIPNSQLRTIPACGHFPPMEKPDAFVQAVTDFLR